MFGFFLAAAKFYRKYNLLLLEQANGLHIDCQIIFRLAGNLDDFEK